jgi:hypothetical protein
MISRTRLNEWKKLVFYDPIPILKSLTNVEARPVFGSGAWDFEPPIQRNAKMLLERLDAAMVAYMLGRVLDIEAHFAPTESSDHDCVLRFIMPKEISLNPVQLKEIVPEAINPRFQFREFIKSLSKYADSEDLIVAVKIGQKEIEENELDVGNLGLAGLWFFGQSANDPNQLWIRGDCQHEAAFYRYPWPQVVASV